ncbi:transmembrane protein 192 isoform X3 [Zootermopsis nevadensis]|uniref:transmembrane protein 192 isoform X3 n=1 Tax=Zootermopsis nevadensis TaxID=136037 RepID=UPI000B8EE075|nr:transmembrane protein 192 isoform X3 [Zootermopsis nevadensis]
MLRKEVRLSASERKRKNNISISRYRVLSILDFNRGPSSTGGVNLLLKYGGLFFNDASLSLSAGGDDSQMLLPVVGTDVEKKFTPLKTVVIVTMELFLSIVDNHIKQKHHALRVNGYLEFYQQTYSHSRIPFYIVSFWNALLLVSSTLLQHLYEDFKQQCSVDGFSKPVNHLCVFIAVETAVLACVILLYIRKVIQFNRSKPPPDVEREEWMRSFIQDSYSGGEVGYRERGDHIYDLLEKQADLIRYLKDRNAKLSHKIMLLSSQIHGEQE